MENDIKHIKDSKQPFNNNLNSNTVSNTPMIHKIVIGEPEQFYNASFKNSERVSKNKHSLGFPVDVKNDFIELNYDNEINEKNDIQNAFGTYNQSEVQSFRKILKNTQSKSTNYNFK